MFGESRSMEYKGSKQPSGRETMIYLAERKENKELSPKEKRKDQSLAAKKLLLFGLSMEYGKKQLPEIACRPQGKPFFKDCPEIKFNYSHSTCGLLCGISTSEIGVDMEGKITTKERLVRRICHENEKKLLAGVKKDLERDWLLTRIWTAKESYLKCIGTGIRLPLDSLDFSGCIDGGLFQERYRMYFSNGTDYVIAVCRESEPSRTQNILVKKLSGQEIAQMESLNITVPFPKQ